MFLYSFVGKTKIADEAKDNNLDVSKRFFFNALPTRADIGRVEEVVHVSKPPITKYALIFQF